MVAEQGTGEFSAVDMQDIEAMAQHAKRNAAMHARVSTYQVDNDLAKRVINEDKFTRDDRQRIPVPVAGEVLVTDMMMPAPTEPSQSMAHSIGGETEESPPMIILLCEQDEDISPIELQAKLAAVFAVDPSRFAITIADA